jgi:hypothetical protein
MTEATNNLGPDTGRRDVQPKASDVLNWSPEQRRDSVHKVYQRAEKHALEAIDWYLRSKKGKKFWAQRLRFSVIILTAIAGLLPIFSQMYEVPPISASIALGLAGTVLAVDKFFGFSSAWMRFIAVEHQIRQSLHEFQVNYELELSGWETPQPSVEQTQKVLNLCKAFLVQVDGIIRQETDKWLAEFQDAIKQIDSAAAAKPESRETGGINVTLSNADQYPQGWRIIVDDGSAVECSGKTAALPGLAPGIHKLRLEAELNQQTKRLERLVSVTGGQIGELTVELV